MDFRLFRRTEWRLGAGDLLTMERTFKRTRAGLEWRSPDHVCFSIGDERAGEYAAVLDSFVYALEEQSRAVADCVQPQDENSVEF